jgi:aspartyl/asparaginyl beta-hydroxylase (cupin superfamily)
MAINNGNETRIHLVVDIEANDKCRRLFRVS